ncbi:MAG: hypothetical protein HND48_00800 [Chloroflexi bacterium]|nr:hypothetical protein [Chloroflexota bacterium]
MREIHKAVGAVNFAQAIRLFGHVEAEIDPLGLPRPGDPELSPEFHGISSGRPAQHPGQPHRRADRRQRVQRVRGRQSALAGVLRLDRL